MKKDCGETGSNPLTDRALVKNGRFPQNGTGEKGSNTAAREVERTDEVGGICLSGQSYLYLGNSCTQVCC